LAVSEAFDAAVASNLDAASPATIARPISALENGPQAAAAEVCTALQLCLPKAAAPLVRPALCAVLSSTPQECASAGIAAVSKLKEDWTEVVHNQAIRSLERRLDCLTYELQKTPTVTSMKDPFLFGSGPERGGSTSERVTLARRRASRDAVMVLTALCEVVSAARSQAEERCRRAIAGLSELGSSMEEWTKPCEGSPSRALQARCGGRCSARRSKDAPSFAECETAVAAMSEKTSSGMARGLWLLGLPSGALHYTPGEELRVRGHDVREAVNEMLQQWIDEDMDAFFSQLQQLQQTVDNAEDSSEGFDGEAVSSQGTPDYEIQIANEYSSANEHSVADLLDAAVDEKSSVRPALLARRAAIVTEREKLLAKLHELDTELGCLDKHLQQGRCSVQSTCGSSRVPSSGASDKTISTSDGSDPSSRKSSDQSSASAVSYHEGCARQFPAAPSLSPLLPSALLPSSAEVVAREITGQLKGVSEAVSAELHRHVDRLSGQMQQRRLQLLLSLVSHLDYETVHLPFTVPQTSEDCGLALRGREAIEAARVRALELCHRVEGALPGVRITPELPQVGARCRGKWMDGNYYDAEIQQILEDGTVLLNWLRPRPGLAKPLVTVSERGGDDTLHRIVLQEDVQLVGLGSLSDPPREVAEVRGFFEGRSQEDLLCADCFREGTEWASVSFGIYLCSACAGVHRELGQKRSLVRPLDGGWGWPILDLAPMRLGGNAAFQKCLESYPAVSSTAPAERYTSRFSEYYRRHLDTLCAGVQPPQPIAQEGAAAPFSSDFLAVSEAAAAAHGSSHRFLQAATAALTRLPARPPRSARQGQTPRVGPGAGRSWSSGMPAMGTSGGGVTRSQSAFAGLWSEGL